MGRLTDLEAAALGEFKRQGPTTGYAVAASFRASPSEFWSGSAGAVYPLVKRLVERGLLEAVPSGEAQRERTGYVITAQGTAALHAWLVDGERAGGMGFDPLRSRLIYFDLLSRAECDALLAQVRAAADALARREIWPAKPLSQKIHAAWMRARLSFLTDIEQLFSEEFSPD